VHLLSLSVFDSPDEMPEGVEVVDQRLRFCEFLKAAFDGRTIAFAAESVGCPLGRYNLGVGPADDPHRAKLAKMLVKWGDVDDVDLAIAYLDGLVQAELEGRWVLLEPEAVDQEADLVVVRGTPREIMTLVARYTARTGETLNFPISGVGASCGEIVGRGLVVGEPTLSLGCGGTRKYGGLSEAELMLGAPPEVYDLMVRKE
jgi:uncharacterized protein (DUF169 family)